MTEFLQELARIRTPATPEEVERARSYAALGLGTWRTLSVDDVMGKPPAVE